MENWYLGIHKQLGVNPDIALLVKPANGIAMGAIIGKKVMKLSTKTFISSAFWTERLGSYVLAFIKKHKRLNLGSTLSEKGKNKKFENS